MEKDGFKFDLVTQRFLVNRWETDLGKRVREEVIEGLKRSVEVRAILDPYVLDQPENIEPYGYPYYPKIAMTKDAFWVLTNDDLRGIHVYSEQFPGSPSFEKKSFSYSDFHNCVLIDVNLDMTDFSYARFEKCNMDGVTFAYSGGFSTRIINYSIKRSCFWMCGFRDCDFRDSDFRGAYFEDVILENLKVNYRTRFDLVLTDRWKQRTMPSEQKADIYRAIRLAYKDAGLWSLMDKYLLQERVAQRKHILFPRVKEEKSIQSFFIWFGSYFSALVSGYSTKPSKVLIIGFIVALFYSLLYIILGTPNHHSKLLSSLLESLYFSFTTFATLGLGDVSYGPDFPFLRILSTSEAWIGAISISLFVVVLGRKIFR